MAGARILLCDDHDALRRLAVGILSSEGHDVVGVASAAEALERLAAERSTCSSSTCTWVRAAASR